VKLIDPPVVTAVIFAEKLVTGTTFMVKAVLLEPVVKGLLAITRIRYPVPNALASGIVALIIPELPSLIDVPMAIGLPKLPETSDNCAVYVLPVKVPRLVNGTSIAAPAQTELAIVPVVTVADTFT
jgi:hypothetical protein